MQRLKLIISLVILINTCSTFAQQADEIIGKYRLPNKLDIDIYKMEGKYFGKIIRLNGYEDGQTKDIKNPDKSKRDDNLLGKVIIKNLEFDEEEKEWINGTIYGPEKGMNLNLKITEIRKNEIVVVGSKYLFWKTLIWERL